MGPRLCRKNDLVQSGRRQKKFKSIDGLSILTKMKENKKTDTKSLYTGEWKDIFGIL